MSKNKFMNIFKWKLSIFFYLCIFFISCWIHVDSSELDYSDIQKSRNKYKELFIEGETKLRRVPFYMKEHKENSSCIERYRYPQRPRKYHRPNGITVAEDKFFDEAILNHVMNTSDMFDMAYLKRRQENNILSKNESDVKTSNVNLSQMDILETTSTEMNTDELNECTNENMEEDKYSIERIEKNNLNEVGIEIKQEEETNNLNEVGIEIKKEEETERKEEQVHDIMSCIGSYINEHPLNDVHTNPNIFNIDPVSDNNDSSTILHNEITSSNEINNVLQGNTESNVNVLYPSIHTLDNLSSSSSLYQFPKQLYFLNNTSISNDSSKVIMPGSILYYTGVSLNTKVAIVKQNKTCKTKQTPIPIKPKTEECLNSSMYYASTVGRNETDSKNELEHIIHCGIVDFLKTNNLNNITIGEESKKSVHENKQEGCQRMEHAYLYHLFFTKRLHINNVDHVLQTFMHILKRTRLSTKMSSCFIENELKNVFNLLSTTDNSTFFPNHLDTSCGIRKYIILVREFDEYFKPLQHCMKPLDLLDTSEFTKIYLFILSVMTKDGFRKERSNIIRKIERKVDSLRKHKNNTDSFSFFLIHRHHSNGSLILRDSNYNFRLMGDILKFIFCINEDGSFHEVLCEYMDTIEKHIIHMKNIKMKYLELNELTDNLNSYATEYLENIVKMETTKGSIYQMDLLLKDIERLKLEIKEHLYKYYKDELTLHNLFIYTLGNIVIKLIIIKPIRLTDVIEMLLIPFLNILEIFVQSFSSIIKESPDLIINAETYNSEKEMSMFYFVIFYVNLHITHTLGREAKEYMNLMIRKIQEHIEKSLILPEKCKRSLAKRQNEMPRGLAILNAMINVHNTMNKNAEYMRGVFTLIHSCKQINNKIKLMNQSYEKSIKSEASTKEWYIEGEALFREISQLYYQLLQKENNLHL